MKPPEQRIKPETIEDRLTRIETRIVKIMEALELDPKTGLPKKPQPLRKDVNEPPRRHS